VVIAALEGTAGVGKTTLAVQWAHRVQHCFPDGTLFTNLRGHGPSTPLHPGLVLGSFLRVLGIPDERIPADLDTQVGLYRSLLVGRRVLVVLDNAGTPEQVRPLLPAAPGCLVLVTSRAGMTGLVVAEAAHRIALDLFTEIEADNLIRQIIGEEKATAEHDAVADLVAACARLPLALRVAATRIASRRSTSIADVVDSITGNQDRLDALSSTGDDYSAVRTVFDWSYTRLPTHQARTFRRLGLHPSTEFGVHATAALTSLDPATAHRHLEALAEVNLVVPVDRRRYRMHDLLHAYAGQRAYLDDTPDNRHRALIDLLNWYARTASSADKVIFPGMACVDGGLDPPGAVSTFADRSEALAWMNTEHTNLTVALQSAVHVKAHRVAICLAGTARFLALRERALWIVRLDAELHGIAAARATQNVGMEAFLLCFRGDTLVDLGRLDEAEAEFESALALARELDDPVRQRAALAGLGQVRLGQHRYLDARSYYQQALPLARSTGDSRAEAVVQCNLSRISVRLGQHAPALQHAEQELVLRRQARDHIGEAYALNDLAAAWQGLGHHETATELADRAIAMYRQLDGTAQYMALALEIAATSFERTGDVERAAQCLREASTILTEFGDPRAEYLRNRLLRIGS
jgi:tetratricopeptide (TPR) repeat protein